MSYMCVRGWGYRECIGCMECQAPEETAREASVYAPRDGARAKTKVEREESGVGNVQIQTGRFEMEKSVCNGNRGPREGSVHSALRKFMAGDAPMMMVTRTNNRQAHSTATMLYRLRKELAYDIKISVRNDKVYVYRHTFAGGPAFARGARRD